MIETGPNRRKVLPKSMPETMPKKRIPIMIETGPNRRKVLPKAMPESMPYKDAHNDQNWSQSKKSATEMNAQNDAEKGCP